MHNYYISSQITSQENRPPVRSFQVITYAQGDCPPVQLGVSDDPKTKACETYKLTNGSTKFFGRT